MKQIKTLIRPIWQSEQYDNEINRLLADGWELKKKEVIRIQGLPEESFNVPVILTLYAELERYRFEEVTV